MDRMAAIERVTEGLMLLREGSHNTRRACEELAGALELLDYQEATADLTEREAQVLALLIRWEGQRSPTFQQIADGCGFSSRNHARDIAISLENKGYIGRSAGRARSITVLKTADGQALDPEGAAA